MLLENEEYFCSRCVQAANESAQLEADRDAAVRGLAGQKRHDHYHKDVSHLKSVDVYRVCDLFDCTDSALAHAVKKILCAGKRGSKGLEQDIKEAVDTLNRRLEMLKEDAK